MKRLFIAALAVLVTCSAFAQGFGGRRSSPNDTLRSTVVEGNRVIFQIYAPNAQNVSVSGDLGAPVRFEKQENGVWKGRLAQIANGVYRYQFNVDGISVYDPKSELAGETRALLKVQPQGDEFFAMKDVPHGALAQRWYYSRTLKAMRRLHVWTPAGYEKNADKLPVFYLIHGGGDNDASWPGVGAAGWSYHHHRMALFISFALSLTVIPVLWFMARWRPEALWYSYLVAYIIEALAIFILHRATHVSFGSIEH